MPLFLTQEDVAFFKENGYVKFRLFSPKEMDRICKEYDELFQRKLNPGMEAAWRGDEMKKAANAKDTSDYSVQSVHNLQMHSAVFTEILTDERLLDALQDVMGTQNIALHHTKAHNKPPKKGAPYLMHQDYLYFPYKNDSMVAVFLNIDDSDRENGGLCVYPGSHKLGVLKDHGVFEDGQEYHWADPAKYPIEGATPIIAKRGEVVIFSYLLLHGSYVNNSDRTRRMFLAQIMAADDEQLEKKHVSPAQGLMLRGYNPRRDATMEKRFHH
ncbi:hypothetical protein FOCC_FOCC012417 [Frankliniella occidentalis]|uniref:Probable alpha-ketoglutarate-dependent hypophosphite dioxygenase n=1 Tax=Frankliniella occidentalis TaxID=133901 RepID=A0A6J1SE79_FRAOC|nr:probable alpha-ketoglutarate-dependent hypophosphite dioxygenase [Frankliniella occidentalis]KAE8742042.1 hypothetical protein FOCC_FOCC012417 [Frankliniella occidentalis]